MHLLELTADIEALEIIGEACDIKALNLDSREVKEGSLFVAIKGHKNDGTQYIKDAVAKGAVAVLTHKGVDVEENVTVIKSDNPRRDIALMAKNFYSNQVERIVAVTGTNGKSSTVSFCRQIWKELGFVSASVGTIGITAPGFNSYGNLTTPDPITLGSTIEKLKESGVERLAIEASSQGMDQYRSDGVNISAMGFTNLTHEHLDYHGDMDNYLESKLRLIKDLVPKGSVAVLNRDADYADAFEKACVEKGLVVVDYGRTAKDIVLLSCTPTPEGQAIEIEVFDERYEIMLPLVGGFQVYNALCAIGLVLSENMGDVGFQKDVVYALEKLESVRGRLELAAKLENGATVYIDYAHTPDAVETVLKSIRPHVKNKLHAIVGCGGDRDRTKRPIMGKAAVDLADVAIITDDNPRTEDPAFIRSEVMAGAVGATEIAGRAEAIKHAVKNLEAGDVLVVAGKGHEQGQEINGEIHHFDDVEEVKKAIEEMAG